MYICVGVCAGACVRACVCVYVFFYYFIYCMLHYGMYVRMYIQTYTTVYVCVCVWYALQFWLSWLTGLHIRIHFQPKSLLVSKAPSCKNIKTWRFSFQKYNQWTHKYVNWLKEIVILYRTKQSSSFNGAGLCWQWFVQFQKNGRRRLPRHCLIPVPLNGYRKSNNCTKISDHTRSKTATLRSYICNIHMHVVILLVAAGNTSVSSALFLYQLLTHFHPLMMVLCK